MAFSTKIDAIDKESQELVDLYLNTNTKSARTIICALRRLVEETKKSDITKINYYDYTTYIKPFVNVKTQAKLKREFIKFLYSYDFLKDESDFKNEFWNKKEYIENFERDKKVHEDKKYRAALTFEQIEKIHQYISHISEGDFDSIKLELSFYLFFYTDINTVTELKEIDSKDYCNGIWTINNSDYEIPERYKPYLLHLQCLQYSKLSNINDYIKQLGELVGIKGLHPKTIIKARKQMQMTCFECGEKYFIFKDNWTCINGKIMCNYCAQELLDISEVKKNYLKNELQCYELDILTTQDKIITDISTNSFDILRQELPNKFDFSRLNEFIAYIGKLGEKYVYENEKSKLINTKYYDMVDITPSLNHENGYDILSFEKNGVPIMIEVKTTTGGETDSFFLTNHELETAKKAWSIGKIYKIYRVGNILTADKNQISLKIYEQLSEENFDITGVVYRVKEKANT
jgi:hypothetical protein